MLTLLLLAAISSETRRGMAMDMGESVDVDVEALAAAQTAFNTVRSQNYYLRR